MIIYHRRESCDNDETGQQWGLTASHGHSDFHMLQQKYQIKTSDKEVTD